METVAASTTADKSEVNNDLLLSLQQQLVDQNRHGGFLLAAGHTKDAVLSFQSALSLLSECTLHCTKEKPSANVFHQSMNLSSDQREVQDFQIYRSEFELQRFKHTTGYLYRHVLSLRFQNDAMSREKSMHRFLSFEPLVEAVILFNIALAFHQYGILSRKEESLCRAISMYQLSFTKMEESNYCCSYTRWLILLVLNNQAQILYERDHYEDAAFQYKNMSDLLGDICGSEGGVGPCVYEFQGLLTPDDVNGMILNVIAQKSPPSCAGTA